MTVVLAPVGYWHAGVHLMPGDDGKKFELKFRARFKHLPRKERELINKRAAVSMAIAAGVEAPEPLKELQPLTDKEFLDQVLLDWDIKDLQGQAVMFTPAMREELFDQYDGLEASFVRCFEDSRREQPAKNSAAPSETS